MNLRTAAVVGLAAAASLAGCGGGSSAPSGSDRGTGAIDERAVLLDVARCLRNNGYPNYPDPVEDPHGGWRWPESAPHLRTDPPECRAVFRRVDALKRSKAPKLSTADVARLRSFARCVREHGASDWPDPNADGSFDVPARFRGPDGKGLYAAQQSACRRYLPRTGIIVNDGGS